MCKPKITKKGEKSQKLPPPISTQKVLSFINKKRREKTPTAPTKKFLKKMKKISKNPLTKQKQCAILKAQKQNTTKRGTKT